MPEVKPKIETFARIKVLGVGGSGTNAVNRMCEMGIRGVEFISINTDAQALHNNQSDKKIHIGKVATKGLGSGMNPELGRAAAEESTSDIEEVVANADMVFITCGLGGGTGTGAAPVIAEVAKKKGILTVAVVTRPFGFEGSKRKEISEVGYETLKEQVDAIISIHNDRILQIIDKKTSLIDAFRTVDDVLRQGIAGISDLITTHGVVNADFADIKTIMHDAGTALMGIGRASGEGRAEKAASMAINSPLLELSIDGATGVLFNITCGRDLGMYEIDEIAKIITKNIDADARVKFGAVIDDGLNDEIRVTVIATGFDEHQKPKGMQISSRPLDARKEAVVVTSNIRPPMERSERLSEKPVENVFERRDNFTENSFSAPPVERPQPMRDMSDLPASAGTDKSNHQASTQINKSLAEMLEIPAFIRKKMK